MRSKKVPTSDCNRDRQPEIAICRLKPKIIISSELWQIASKLNNKFGIFDYDEVDKSVVKWFRQWRTAQIARWVPKRLYCYFRLSVVVAVARGQFFKLRFAIGISILSVIFSEAFPIFAAISLFPVVGRRCNYLTTLISTCGRKFQICRWNFNDVFHSFRNTLYKYFRFRQPFPIVGYYWNCQGTFYSSRKPQVCRWNFGDICHTFRDVGTSVLPIWVAILLLPIVHQCRIYLWTLSSSLPWSKT